MKKYLAMLLAVVMVFALGASAFAADTGDTYSSYTFTDFNLTVQVSTTVEGLTLSGSGRSATLAPVTGSRDAAGLLSDLQQRGRHEL